MGGLAKKLLTTAGQEEKLDASDVFSTYLYTGNGSTQTINNGIDLAGKGGLVWIKSRNAADGHAIYDTTRPIETSFYNVAPFLSSNSTDPQYYPFPENNGLSSFGSSGFEVRRNGVSSPAVSVNVSGTTYTSWTFRKAPKFFDVVTWAGDGANNRVLAHSLGIQPGMIVVKRITGGTENWPVWHRGVSSGGAGNLFLNLTNGLSGNKISDADATSFTLSTSDTSHNAVGSTYVAYLFAHDPSEDGIIQCGSFTTDGSGNATVNLGWEPQYLITKRTDNLSGWFILDTMRGWVNGGTPATADDSRLEAQSSAAEITGDARGSPLSTGFNIQNSASATFIYLAIRRPNKPPTSGTEVFAATYGWSTNPKGFTTGFPVDLDIACTPGTSSPDQFLLHDRLRGAKTLITTSTAAEVTHSYDSVGYFQNDLMNRVWNTLGTNWFNWAFRRAPGFFDVVCYTGTGVARTVNHNLGGVPELMIVKSRTGTTNWTVYHRDIGPTGYGELNNTNAFYTPYAGNWNNTAPTSSIFSLGTDGAVNSGSAWSYVAYLFASIAGISKIFSYVGNGTSQNIECGFTTGARFIMVKASSTTGDWLIADTARGVVAGADPRLSLNTTAAEVTTEDWVDSYAGGFTVNQVAGSNANVNGVTYIGMAIA